MGMSQIPSPMKRFILLSVSVLKIPDLEKSLAEADRMLIDCSSLQWCSEAIDTALKPLFWNEVNAYLRNRKEMDHSMRMWLTRSVWHSSLKSIESIIRDFMTHEIWEDRFLKKTIKSIVEKSWGPMCSFPMITQGVKLTQVLSYPSAKDWHILKARWRFRFYSRMVRVIWIFWCVMTSHTVPSGLKRGFFTLTKRTQEASEG